MTRIPGRAGLVNLKWKDKRGASMVEFAIILPVLLLIVFGIIEFSLLLYDQAVITNASREGARFAALYYYDPNAKTYGYTNNQICTAVTNYVQNYLITFNSGYTFSCAQNVQIAPRTVDANGSYVRSVTINYPYQFLVLPNFATGMVGTLNLSARTLMRDEDQAEH